MTRPSWNAIYFKTAWSTFWSINWVERFRGHGTGFRPLPEHEIWCADVAMFWIERWSRIDRSGWVSGAPDLVIEVLSPSNTLVKSTKKKRSAFKRLQSFCGGRRGAQNG